MGYDQGFAGGEESEPRTLEVSGRLPKELRGVLLRNGPGLYRLAQAEFAHWFDGLAQLHRFELDGQQVRYSSRFVESPDFVKSRASGKIAYPGFATDPCIGLFRRLKSLFVMDVTYNPNVSITTLEDRFLALTELPMPVEFDPDSLETLGVVEYSDALGPGMTTAHPLRDGDFLFNYSLKFGPRSAYRLYRQSRVEHRQIFAEVPVEEASYIHSFGLTERYLVLAAYPFRVKPLKLLLRNRPFIENFSWRPHEPTRFYLCCRQTGEIRSLEGPPFFCFHHIHAHDEPNGAVVLDLVSYPDAGVIEDFYLDHLRAGRPIRKGRWQRWRLGPGEEVEQVGEGSHPVELPYFAGDSFYGVGAALDAPFYERLVRMDFGGQLLAEWHRPGHFPGEPVVAGDYVLSVVLDSQEESSYLVVLDRDLRELAQARVGAAIPFGFHGLFK